MVEAETISKSSDSKDGSPNPVPIRFVLGTAGVLLLALVAIAALTDLGRSEVVVYDAPLALPSDPMGTSATTETPPPIVLSPPFELEGPTTLRVELHRSAEPGWVGATCALIEEETGNLYEFEIHTDHRPPNHPQERTSALIDRLPTGRYILRIQPAWRPIADPLPGRATSPLPPPPTASVQAVEGGGSPWAFLIAAILILAPAAFETARFFRFRHRRWTKASDSE
ncbi:MAG: hypothetical protein AAGF12_32040 [Myxococcota bacterium]